MTVGLSAADERELAALRRRAYGPDADLDEEGERRLRALEGRDTPPPVVADDIPGPSNGDGDGTDAGEGPADEPAPGRRRHPLLAVAAVVAGAALLVGLGYLLARPSAGADADAGTLAAVELDPEAADRVTRTASFGVRDLDPVSIVQYETLGQGTPWSATRPDGRRCLILTVTDDSPEMVAAAGIWDVACAPAGLAPIIDWEVDRAFPSPPQTLPEGSVVRLTLDDDAVGLTIGRAG